MSVYWREGDHQSIGSRLSWSCIAAMTLMACSSLDPALDSCVTLGAADCDPTPEGNGSGMGNDDDDLPENWRCLAEGFTPEPPVASSAMQVTYLGSVLDFRSTLPMDPTVTPCLINDFACTPPLFGQATVVPPTASEPRRRFSAALPRTFEGFLRLTADGYIPFDYYLGGPMLNNVDNPLPFNMVSVTSFNEFMRGLGADPTEVAPLGVVAVYVYDCDNNLAEGVTLRLTDADSDPDLSSVLPWAIQRRIPVANRATDSDGIAGFVLLPIKNVSVEGEWNGRRFGTTSVRIEAGRLTSGVVRPFYNDAL